MVGLLVTINSCDILIDHYETIDDFTTYYIGDSCIFTIIGTHVIDKESYEISKKDCDRSEFFVVRHEDIIQDTSFYIYHKEHYVKEGNGVVRVPETIDTTRYLYFVANKTNANLRATIPGIRLCDGYKRIYEAEILTNINMQEVDSIIIDLFYNYH